MDANEPKNAKSTRLRCALGQIEAQSLLVHGFQRPGTQDFADFKGTHPIIRREVGSFSSTLILRGPWKIPSLH